jgi:hypothetical protein
VLEESPNLVPEGIVIVCFEHLHGLTWGNTDSIVASKFDGATITVDRLDIE